MVTGDWDYSIELYQTTINTTSLNIQSINKNQLL